MASAFVLLALIVGLMGLVLLSSDGLTTFTICHFAVSASFLWLAYDLIHRASLVDPRGIPHPSQGALMASILILRVASPTNYVEEFGAVPVIGLSLLGLGLAVVALMAGDLLASAPLAYTGRLMLVLAGTVHGITQLTRMANGLDAYPLYSLGLGLIGVLMLAMVVFEARVLRLAIQWLFVGSRPG